MSVVDSAMTREVLRDISKRPLDISQLNVHVTHGVVYLAGRIDKLRGYHEDIDLHQEFHMVVRLLKQKIGVRDVLCEVEVAGQLLNERVTSNRNPSYR